MHFFDCIGMGWLMLKSLLKDAGPSSVCLTNHRAALSETPLSCISALWKWKLGAVEKKCTLPYEFESHLTSQSSSLPEKNMRKKRESGFCESIRLLKRLDEYPARVWDELPEKSSLRPWTVRLPGNFHPPVTLGKGIYVFNSCTGDRYAHEFST